MGVIPAYARAPWANTKPLKKRRRKPRKSDNGKAASAAGMKRYTRALAAANQEPVKIVPKHAVYPAPIPADTFAIATAAVQCMYPVPLPSERVRPDDVTYFSRDGQSVFRETILAVYGGKCTITGCTVRATLEAAHIVPYVDRRSNIVINGLCLRADVHRLYDRNLIRIDYARRIDVAAELMGTGYWKYRGLYLDLPMNMDDWPNSQMLGVRHRFIEVEK